MVPFTSAHQPPQTLLTVLGQEQKVKQNEALNEDVLALILSHTDLPTLRRADRVSSVIRNTTHQVQLRDMSDLEWKRLNDQREALQNRLDWQAYVHFLSANRGVFKSFKLVTSHRPDSEPFHAQITIPYNAMEFNPERSQRTLQAWENICRTFQAQDLSICIDHWACIPLRKSKTNVLLGKSSCSLFLEHLLRMTKKKFKIIHRDLKEAPIESVWPIKELVWETLNFWSYMDSLTQASAAHQKSVESVVFMTTPRTRGDRKSRDLDNIKLLVNLKSLRLGKCLLNDFELPSHLQELVLLNCVLSRTPTLPQTLQRFIIKSQTIGQSIRLRALPSTLKVLSITSCPILDQDLSHCKALTELIITCTTGSGTRCVHSSNGWISTLAAPGLSKLCFCASTAHWIGPAFPYAHKIQHLEVRNAETWRQDYTCFTGAKYLLIEASGPTTHLVEWQMLSQLRHMILKNVHLGPILETAMLPSHLHTLVIQQCRNLEKLDIDGLTDLIRLEAWEGVNHVSWSECWLPASLVELFLSARAAKALPDFRDLPHLRHVSVYGNIPINALKLQVVQLAQRGGSLDRILVSDVPLL